MWIGIPASGTVPSLSEPLVRNVSLSAAAPCCTQFPKPWLGRSNTAPKSAMEAVAAARRLVQRDKYIKSIAVLTGAGSAAFNLAFGSDG